MDRLGMLASSLCAVHCAICALLPALFGAIGAGFLLGDKTEWLFTLVAIAFATGALALGWRRHRSRRVAVVMTAGIVGLLVSRVAEGHDGHHDHHAEASASEHADASEHAHASEHADASEHAHASEPSGGLDVDAGAAVGVLAGLLLLTGHVLNLRASRCCAAEDCS